MQFQEVLRRTGRLGSATILLAGIVSMIRNLDKYGAVEKHIDNADLWFTGITTIAFASLGWWASRYRYKDIVLLAYVIMLICELGGFIWEWGYPINSFDLVLDFGWIATGILLLFGRPRQHDVPNSTSLGAGKF